MIPTPNAVYRRHQRRFSPTASDHTSPLFSSSSPPSSSLPSSPLPQSPPPPPGIFPPPTPSGFLQGFQFGEVGITRFDFKEKHIVSVKKSNARFDCFPCPRICPSKNHRWVGRGECLEVYGMFSYKIWPCSNHGSGVVGSGIRLS